MNKESQRAKILAYCMEHGSITVREAFEKLNINSPTKRISELRNAPGYDVQDEQEERLNSEGNLVRYKRYRIRKVQHGA